MHQELREHQQLVHVQGAVLGSCSNCTRPCWSNYGHRRRGACRGCGCTECSTNGIGAGNHQRSRVTLLFTFCRVKVLVYTPRAFLDVWGRPPQLLPLPHALGGQAPPPCASGCGRCLDYVAAQELPGAPSWFWVLPNASEGADAGWMACRLASCLESRVSRSLRLCCRIFSEPSTTLLI